VSVVPDRSAPTYRQPAEFALLLWEDRPGDPPAGLQKGHAPARDVVTVTMPRSVVPGILLEVSARIREVLGEVDHPCHFCGDGCAVALETRPIKRFRDRFRSNPDHRVRRFETCLDCGTTVRVLPVKARPVGGWDLLGRGFPTL
jgi:hypothetical protein